MTKDDIIKRLKVLGNELGREVSVSGTKEETEMRLRELEEELAEMHSGNDDTAISTNNDDSVATSAETVSTETPSETKAASAASAPQLVTVTALKSLHTDGRHEHRDEKTEFVPAGTVFRVSADKADALREAGLIQQYSPAGARDDV